MDLSKFDTVKAAESGAFLHLEFEGEKLYDEATKEPVGLWCYGADSPQYQRSKHRQQDSRINRARWGKGGRIKNIKAEETDQEALELVAGVVYKFQHICIGEPMDYSFENAVLLFERCPWALEQADDFIHDRANFRV